MTGQGGGPEAPELPLEDENAGEGRAPFVPQPRQGRGRPAGAVNKTTLQLARWAAEKGMRDPGVLQLEFCNADPLALLAWIRESDPACEIDLAGVLKMQLEVADRVHPYFRGKVAAPAEVTGDLPVIVIGAGPGRRLWPGDGTAVQAVGAPRRYSILDATKLAENREFSEVDRGASHETEGGGGRQVIDDKG